jgi:ATP-dependent DNA helicase RecQ
MDKRPEEILEQYWGYPGFRGSQAEIIASAMAGKDVIALLPTGGGKSVCYQVPGLAMPGLCLVVSPLLALMEDQVADLKGRGIRAMSLSGKLRQADLMRKLDNAEFGNFDFLYLSPERLGQDLVLERLKTLEINLIAIDEAHCISQWGFDFRPAYRKCAVLRDLHPGVPMMALTATATPEVLADVEKSLAMEAPRIFRDSVHRPNIVYSLQQTEDKNYRLRKLLGEHPGSAIVYVQTRRATVSLASYLSGQGIRADAFHGGLDGDRKSKLLRDWQAGSLRVMVATNAFGMGIDKADVRLVVHYEVPETLEHYFQEAGRAGRDGNPARAELLLAPGDIARSREHYLGSLPEVRDVLNTYRKLNAYFKLPYGELAEGPFSFRFADFCETYHLPIPVTFNALELLDRQGVLSLSQQFWQTTRIRFVCGKESLWKYMETYPGLQPAIQVLLRTYGGLFDFPTPVDLRSLSARLSVSETTLLGQLKQLEKDGLVELETAQGDLEVRFLVPREDERTIFALSGSIEQRLKVKREKVAQMAAYLTNDRVCRQVQLLRYFGEQSAQPCGSCDVCLAGKPLDAGALLEVEEALLHALRQGPKTSRELLQSTGQPEAAALTCLQRLLHRGTLVLGAENQYSLP